jgi:hypothetical protein
MALAHIMATPLDELQRDTGLLDGLAQREHAEERELTRQVVDFYWSMRERKRVQSEEGLATVGGFENSWTHAEGARGVSAEC